MTDTTPVPADADPEVRIEWVSPHHRLPEDPPPPTSDLDDPWEYRAPNRDVEPPRRFWKAAGIAAFSAVIGAATAAGFFLAFDGSDTVQPVVERVETQIVTAEGSLAPAAAVAQRVLPSIVTVEVGTAQGSGFTTVASGSGVVLSEDGILVTNEHVVGGASDLRVVFADGRAYEAALVGTDSLTDLAVVSIDAIGLTPVELGSTDEMSIGDTAIAIGSPLGLEGGPSVTVGVLSAFDRRVRVAADTELFGLLQTDAPITRGSSGGALVDDRGRLIGITSAIGVSDVGAEGLGFAIPVELMSRITTDILEFGHARHAFLGITGVTHFEREADGAIAPAGVSIESILDETAAAQSGIRVGDIILSFDGVPVTTMDGLVVRLRFYRVGDTTEMEVRRGSDVLTIDISLQERPEGV